MASISEIAGRTFKRTSGTDLSAYKNDIKTFNILMAMDGIRSVATIAREDFYEVEALVEKVNQFVEMGLLESIHGASGANVDPEFIAALQSELTNVVGPVAGKLIKKNTSKLGYDLSAFPVGKAGELVDMLSKFIQDHTKSVEFRQRLMAHINK